VQIGKVKIGEGAPLALISGLNVLEKRSAAIECAHNIRTLARRHDIPLVF
jgi:3-deoxy-D-manno-octulosonic acid (KDO) 8-phosphate synthase